MFYFAYKNPDFSIGKARRLIFTGKAGGRKGNVVYVRGSKILAGLISNFISCNYLTRNFSEVGNRCVIYIRSQKYCVTDGGFIRSPATSGDRYPSKNPA